MTTRTRTRKTNCSANCGRRKEWSMLAARPCAATSATARRPMTAWSAITTRRGSTSAIPASPRHAGKSCRPPRFYRTSATRWAAPSRASTRVGLSAPGGRWRRAPPARQRLGVSSLHCAHLPALRHGYGALPERDAVALRASEILRPRVLLSEPAAPATLRGALLRALHRPDPTACQRPAEPLQEAALLRRGLLWRFRPRAPRALRT